MSHCWMLDRSYSSVDDKERCLRCGAIRSKETEEAPCQSKGRQSPSEPSPEPKPAVSRLELIAALRQLSTAVGLIRLGQLPSHSRSRVAAAHSEAEAVLRKLDRT